jgi:hypothetical protein
MISQNKVWLACPPTLLHEGLADAVRGFVDLAQQFDWRQALQCGVFIQCIVGIGDIGGMVLAMVDGHGLGIDVGLEGGYIVCECR